MGIERDPRIFGDSCAGVSGAEPLVDGQKSDELRPRLLNRFALLTRSASAHATRDEANAVSPVLDDGVSSREVTTRLSQQLEGEPG